MDRLVPAAITLVDQCVHIELELVLLLGSTLPLSTSGTRHFLNITLVLLIRYRVLVVLYTSIAKCFYYSLSTA